MSLLLLTKQRNSLPGFKSYHVRSAKTWAFSGIACSSSSASSLFVECRIRGLRGDACSRICCNTSISWAILSELLRSRNTSSGVEHCIVLFGIIHDASLGQLHWSFGITQPPKSAMASFTVAYTSASSTGGAPPVPTEEQDSVLHSSDESLASYGSFCRVGNCIYMPLVGTR